MRLPQQDGDLFITDGGMETTLIFHERLKLPSFASFVLLEDDAGRQALRDYYEPYVAVAREHGVGAVLDTATWRANPDWGTHLGYSDERLAEMNRRAVSVLEEVRAANPDVRIVINGVVGPRGDGYVASDLMTAEEAERYHAPQIATLGETDADMITGLTINYAEEAVGIARASRIADMPVAISFTVETDGRLPSGQSLEAAISQVESETGNAPAYYMINCAHPTHFAGVLEGAPAWTDRIRGLRANASRLSHAELDEAEELDEGDRAELGDEYRALRQRLRNLNVVGGCCGTDHRHVGAICSRMG
jgi:S-methylmethionine-dependent homocysteine/selenocysteine methylase